MALPVAEFLALEHGTEYAGGSEDIAKVGEDEQQARAHTHLRLAVLAPPFACVVRLHSSGCRRLLPVTRSCGRWHRRGASGASCV